jgi:hypothetical protein
MMQRRVTMILTLLWAISACHTTPPKRPPAPAPQNSPAPSESTEPPANTAPFGDDDVPMAEAAEIPPCLPADNTPKPAPKRKPKPVVRTEPPSPAPPPAPPPQVAEAGVQMLPTSSSSLLGRKVRGQEGDDLGRVVDVLADAQGRVRVAIIEFGGFLGVGNRRIAVDWSLLKFQPEDPDAPVVLDAAKRKLQETPEYKGSARPLALMGPEATAAPRPTTPN